MFKSARIKLTAWYLIILMVITLSFSYVIYSSVSDATKRALESQRMRIEKQFIHSDGRVMYERLGPRFFPGANEETVREIRLKVLATLAIINISMLAIAGTFGYFLAGKTLEPIEKMVEKQKRFISDAAHEIKTPLTALKTNFEVTLRNKNLTVAEAKEALTSAIEETDTLNRLTEQLLVKSRFQSDSHKSKSQQFDLNNVISRIIQSNKQNKIVYAQNPLIIYGVESEIESVVRNLIDNAIKYNRDDNDVEVILHKDGNNAVIKVSDKGLGISKEDLKRIFDPFYRADKSRTNGEKNGTGLGLAIAKDIVSNHGGTIAVESELNKGSIFTVTLPISANSQ